MHADRQADSDHSLWLDRIALAVVLTAESRQHRVQFIELRRGLPGLQFVERRVQLSHHAIDAEDLAIEQHPVVALRERFDRQSSRFTSSLFQWQMSSDRREVQAGKGPGFGRRGLGVVIAVGRLERAGLQASGGGVSRRGIELGVTRVLIVLTVLTGGSGLVDA